MKFLGNCVILIIIIACSMHQSYGQLAEVYMDVGASFPKYQNVKYFEHSAKPNFLINYGMAFRFKPESKFTMKGEIGFVIRSLNRDIPGYSYSFILPTGQLAVAGQYDFTQNLFVDAGLKFALYTRHFSGNSESVSNIEAGFSNIDLIAFAGMGVKVWKVFHLGLRCNYGFVPLLHRDVVTRDGQLVRDVNELNYAALDVFVRMKFLKQ